MFDGYIYQLSLIESSGKGNVVLLLSCFIYFIFSIMCVCTSPQVDANQSDFEVC